MGNKNCLLIDRLTCLKQECLSRQTKRQYSQNESFQQNQFHNLQNSQLDLIETLILLYSQETTSIPLLDRLTANSAQHATCLLTYCSQISQVQEGRCTISHLQSSSQSPLLALFLAKTMRKKQVHLVISDKSLLSAGHIMVDPSEIDKLSFMRYQLAKEGVILHSIDYWNKKPLPLNSGDILIFDAFGLSPVDYSPLLLQTCSLQLNLEQTYIYHSQLQDQEIEVLLRTINCQTFVPLQIWPEHPRQFIVEKSEEQLLQQLIQFLREDINHPHRQDVVVFSSSDLYVCKLQDELAKTQLKNQVHIVAKPNQSGLIDKKNKVFVVEGTRQLQKWNYDYSNVFLVIDYCKDISFTFDYSQGTYVKYSGHCSQMEKGRRMAQVAVNKSGKYVSLMSQVVPNQHYASKPKEISAYLLKMIDFGLSKFIDKTNERTAACLELMKQLKIIIEESGEFTVADERIVEAAKKGISPIQSKLVFQILEKQNQSKEERERRSNLLLMGLVIWHSEHSMRQPRQHKMSVSIKPKDIWRRSGYLQSCLQVLTKCELIQFRKKTSSSKSQSFRRKTSKVSGSDFFGSLFVEQYGRKSFEDMDVFSLTRHYGINPDAMMKCRDEIDDFRQQLNIQQTNIIFEPSDLHEVISHLLPYFNKAVAIYSGSRKTGFVMSGSQDNILPSKQCLISQLNERPEFLFVLQLCKNDKNIKQILICNSFTAEQYLNTFGKLVPRQSQSQSEIQVEFYGVATTTFQSLQKDEEKEIICFERDHDCIIETNHEMAMIKILCRKDKAEEVKDSFQIILARIRQQLLQSTKTVFYLNNTILLLGAGGIIKQIIKPDCISKCSLQNLDLSITKDDLEDLFDELFILKGIQMIKPQKNSSSKSAIIHFHSPNDYNRFNQSFNGCLYYDKLLQVKPIKYLDEKNKNRHLQYIEFKWYAWKSHCKGLARYQTAEIAQNSMLQFNTDFQHNLDDAKIKVSLKGNKLIFQDLKSTTDEIYLKEALSAYGKVNEVQILRTPLKETEGDSKMLQIVILEALKSINVNLNFVISPIDKHQNGLRTCRVEFEIPFPRLPSQQDNMIKIAKELDKTIGKLGEARLYASTWFQSWLPIPRGLRPIYQWMLLEYQQNYAHMPMTYITEKEDKTTYLVMKSSEMSTLSSLTCNLFVQQQGQPVILTEYQKNIVLTDNGLANLMDLEDKYQAKFHFNFQKQLLSVCVPSKYHQQIRRQIQQCLDKHFFYSVSINRKAYKFFKTNPDKLNNIRSQFDLVLVEIEGDSMTILLEGSAVNVQKAFNYILHFIESLTVPQEKIVNSDLCGICCEEMIRSYRLQACGHKFCRDCLVLDINTTLSNSSLFPIRCPQCRVNIVIKDLELIIHFLEFNTWQKLQNIAANKYVAQHSDIMIFCYKPGCKQIVTYQDSGNSIECDFCHSRFCTKCKQDYHFNSTCQEANDEAVKKYMKQNKVRNCANPKCRMLVMKYTGCCNVMCTLCKIYMCFKCDPDNMVSYPQKDHGLIYTHLTEVHGGYYD